jgi:hypothetical protein
MSSGKASRFKLSRISSSFCSISRIGIDCGVSAWSALQIRGHHQPSRYSLAIAVLPRGAIMRNRSSITVSRSEMSGVPSSTSTAPIRAVRIEVVSPLNAVIALTKLAL